MRVQLYAKLQLLDCQLVVLKQRMLSLDEQLREGAAVRALYERRREVSGRLKHERGRATELQWELDEIETRLRDLQTQEQEGPSDPLVARELSLLREQRDQLETQALEQMERVEQLVGELTDADSAWRERSVAWTEREPGLRDELEQVMRQLEALQNERHEVAGGLAPEALVLYDDLQRRYRGTAIAPIRNRACGVCRARLPAAVFDLLAGPDPLVRCPRCGRVLTLPARDEPAADDCQAVLEQPDATP